MISSSGALMDSLRQHPVLSADQLAQLPNLTQGRCSDARSFAKSLIQRGWLSVYQVNRLLAGKANELLIGPYHVLDKLGQGGLSQVVKAKHRDSGQIVAIKIIKPEVFASPEGRQQFLQEVEAMARLDHPNIVQFCDADQWKDTFYFAMEYVEGTDLGKLVRLSGALRIGDACDYVRQAALGLQHAYERNLIHRDIKPVNLFLTLVSQDRPASEATTSKGKATLQIKPLIKILDWGLASLRKPTGSMSPSNLDEPEKNIIGTADYLAPEQARDANSADIRSDIYSLGCTLYFLLTGQPPFPDGSLMQKLMAHQNAQPRPVSDFRTDVPANVIGVLKRMLAKAPEDRFQTPASVVMALANPLRRPGSGSSPLLPVIVPPRPQRDDTPLPPALAKRADTPGTDDTPRP